MSVPTLGYIFDDNAKAIRLVSGVPGAASLEGSIAIDTSLESAFLQSRSRAGVVNTKEGAVVLVRWNGGVRLTTLATALGRVTQVAFSGTGDRAALSDGTSVEVWTSLDGDPARASAYSPDGGVRAVAMSREGAVAVATGSGAIVLLSDEPGAVATGGDWAGLAFLPNGTDLLATDASAQSLVLIKNVQSSPAASTVASLGEKPGALAVAMDGTEAALGIDDGVAVVGLANGDIRTVSCGCHAGRFELLEGNLVARIIDAQSGSALLLDGDSAEPRIASLPETNRGAAQ
jgi:hypothetical protein